MAISSPLLEVSIDGAKGILYNIIGGSDLSMSEVSDASTIIASAAAPDANIIFGATINEELGSSIKISVIATGFDEKQLGYASSTRPIFGAFSRESQKRLTPQPPTLRGFSTSTPEPENQPVKIDRAPSSFTQPLTKTQMTDRNPVQFHQPPIVRSQAFGDQVNIPVTPPPAMPKPPIMEEEKKPTPSPLPVSQVGGANEFEDEFDIPAFLRNKK